MKDGLHLSACVYMQDLFTGFKKEHNIIYHSINEEYFKDFCRENNFFLAEKKENVNLYHVVYWLYNQFKSYKCFYMDFQDKNGFEIFNECKDSFSPNCACFSIMLNDLLISMGFNSKAVWCLSGIPGDTECHALNHVRIPSTNTWITVDPSSRSIICDKDGKPLDLLAIRNIILNGGRVFPHRNKTIRQPPDFIDEYNKYMKKNLFQFLTHFEQGLSYPLDHRAILIHPVGMNVITNKSWQKTSDISYLF